MPSVCASSLSNFETINICSQNLVWTVSLKAIPNSYNFSCIWGYHSDDLDDSSTLKMETLRYSETSGDFYRTKKNAVALVRYRTMPTERPPLLGEVVPTFADRECCSVSATDPPGRILGFLDRFYRTTLSYIPEGRTLRAVFSLLSWIRKNRVGLWDHVAVCVCVPPLLTFERLNQTLWNLLRISRHLSPSQRPN
jgi:hypothetical protein